MKRIVFACIVSVVLILLSGCIVINPNPSAAPAQSASQSVEVTPEPSASPVLSAPISTPEPTASADPIEALKDRSAQALSAIQSGDFVSLAKLVHPTKGVRFTPYANVSKDDIVFTAQEIKTLGANKKIYNWGVFDGSGEPINLTYADYAQKFVNDADFAKAPEVAVNERLGGGNTIDNSKEFYPDASFVEYHYDGFDKQYDGMDWKSLRLVFEQVDGTWYLVGVIHDQWTI